MLRRTFLKACGAVCGAFLGLFPSFATVPADTVPTRGPRGWTIVVPPHDGIGPVIESGFSFMADAESAAKRHANGAKYFVMRSNRDLKPNGIPCHLHPKTAGWR